MDFNFYERYQELSTTELLKIVKQASQYESQAIDAANRVLAGRDISEDEWAYVDSYFAQEAAIAEKKRERANVVRAFFLAFLQPDEKNELLYVNGVIMLLIVRCLHLTYSYYRPGGIFHVCKSCVESWQALSFLTPVLFAAIIGLMVYRKRWGWLLLFGYCFAAVIQSGLDHLFTFIRYKEYYITPGIQFFVGLLLRVFCLVILSRSKVMELFGVTEDMRRTTAIVAAILAVLHAMLIHMSPA
jgi:hypothetical protein